MKRMIVKIFSFLLLNICIMASISAQSPDIDDQSFDAGFGIGWPYRWGYNVTSFPALHLAYEKCMFELDDFGMISIGGVLEYKNAHYKSSIGDNDYKYSWNTVIAGARGTLHADLLEVENLDTYGGIGLGVRYLHFGSNYSGTETAVEPGYNDFIPFFGIFAGAKYYFTDNIGAFAEVGWGLSVLNFGVSMKF